VVGDSPLFLYRGGKLTQLNEDHSMAPQIDFMVKSGLMDAEVGANHPDRNCLISVLMGTRIPKIDCPTKPYELKAGDIVVCSSDGLQFMTNAQIEKVLGKYRKTRSTEIAERLLQELNRLDDPDQDNISFTIIKINDASVRSKEHRPPRHSVVITRPRRLTTVAPEMLKPPVQKAPPPAAPLPERRVAISPMPVAQTVQESNQERPVEDLTPARLRPRRVTVIK
jgi:PPM family protein phosphatase